MEYRKLELKRTKKIEDDLKPRSGKRYEGFRVTG
jgi:hypothetical protein